MRNQRLNYVVVGVFTLAMLVAGIGSMVMLSGRTGETEAYQSECGRFGYFSNWRNFSYSSSRKCHMLPLPGIK